MVESEERAMARRSASRCLMAGLALAGAGYLPLQLYILFGPRDGNPVGLGVWAVLAIFAGLVVVAIGLIKWALHCFLRGRG